MADNAFFIPHWTTPVPGESGDNAFWIIRYVPSAVLPYGIYNHITFKNRKVFFYYTDIGNTVLWNFGDGTSSEKSNPFHIYTKAGTYTIRIYINGVETVLENQVIVFENSFVLDAGAVYLNYGEKNQMLLGATEGGNAFGIENDFRYMTFDGVKGTLTHSHRLIGSVPKIIANMIEINYKLLNTVLPGSNISFNSGSIMIERAIKKLIQSDYITNIAIVAEHGGTGCYIVFKILNAVSLENFEIPFEDSAESVIECIFAGCFHPDNLDNEPWEIDFQIIN